MERNPLKIVSVEPSQTETKYLRKEKAQREETQALMERLWHRNPNQFDPLRNCKERERLERTMHLLREFLPLSGQMASDLGCAGGEFSRQLHEKGATVHAVDISGLALKRVEEKKLPNVEPIQDCLPHTNLQNDAYDLVVCTEVIAYLNAQDYRVLFAELSRIVKPEGYVVCSTALDVNTEDPLDRFAKLAETEFNIAKWRLSYHLLHIRFCDFFEGPSRFISASQDPHLRHEEIEKRRGFSRLWFKWNSTYLMSLLWYPVQIITRPIAYFLRQNRPLMLALEKITHFLWSESGISQAIFIGQRRPLAFPLPANEKPKEIKHKKQIWE